MAPSLTRSGLPWPGVSPPPSGPWFHRHPGSALAAAAMLYAGVLALRLAFDNPLDAISMLYVFPVGLVALTGGRWVGLAGGTLAVVLVAAWVLSRDVDLTLLGWLSRALPLVLVGFLIGDASDRLEHASLERQARLLAIQRQHEAVEINDSLVQGMSAAKWSIESGQVESGLTILEETVRLGHRLASELIRGSDTDPPAGPVDRANRPRAAQP